MGFHGTHGTQGQTQKTTQLSPTGLSPSTAELPNSIRLTGSFVTSASTCGYLTACPTTPRKQRPQTITPARFGLVPVRSPLLGESRLISFPPGTEMFHFPGFAPYTYEFSIW